MYAIIETGGKQYKVSKGEALKIEKLKTKNRKNFEEGDKIVFNEVLLKNDGKKTQIGTPLLKNARVEAKIEKIGRAPKIDVIKYKAKSRYFKKRGHRQPYFKVRIEKIS